MDIIIRCGSHEELIRVPGETAIVPHDRFAKTEGTITVNVTIAPFSDTTLEMLAYRVADYMQRGRR